MTRLSHNTYTARQLLSAWQEHDALESILPVSFLLSLTFIPILRRWHESNLSEYRAVKSRISQLKSQ